MMVSVSGGTVTDGGEIETVIQRIVDALPGADNVGGSPTWPSGKSEVDMVARLSGCAFRLKAVDGETRGRLVAVPAGATRCTGKPRPCR